ncbi:hypothetical protein PUMCH_001978 [Australozyma saopauloensis]|uniref:Acyl-CoA desaturase n=1 Tax=Australozyma saopauloensis TaxID=291208 RepID=A0AAX4H825_9ASCO|nr:hypothetical protein PUMCH_001978 [[Candida] saopauloensis]
MSQATSRGVKIQKRKTQILPGDSRTARKALQKRKQDFLRRINYFSLLTAVLLPLCAIAYLIKEGLSVLPENPRTRWLGVIYYCITMLAFTAGYHKYYAHSTFRIRSSLLHVFFVVFGASIGLGPVRVWAAMHRAHHQYTDDVDRDPYSIKRGFLWAHWGWLLKRPKSTTFYKEFIEQEFPIVSGDNELSSKLTTGSAVITESDLRIGNALETYEIKVSDSKDRQRQTLEWMAWQESWNFILFILTSLLIPTLVAIWYCGDTWVNGLIYSGILRMFVSQQLIFFTESICHAKWLQVTIPSQPFNDKNLLVDCLNPIVALLTFGQALQNYHHEFPHDYRVSSLTWAFDPTKWFIWSLSCVGLVDELCKTPKDLVMQLRIQQKQQVLNHMRSQLNWGTPLSKLPMITAKEFNRLCQSAAGQDRIYIVIQNVIHDITPFMDQHPGGLALLQASHGKDATKAFYGGVYGHLTAAVNLLATMRIGVLDTGDDEGVWRRVAREEGDVDARDERQGGQHRSAEAA